MEVWPDGTYAMSYAFIHALYQEVVYSQVSASRKARWHQQIGVAEETSYGPQAADIAAELSTHFLRARDGHRAIGYLHQAGTNAMRRHAYQEGIDLLRQGLDALALFPDVTERLEPELTLQLTLGGALIAARGYAAPEVEIAYERARQLCGQIGANPRLLRVQLGLAAYYFSRAALETATELGEQCVSLAQRDGAPAHLVQAHYALGSALMFRGQFAQTQDHFDQGIALYEPSHHQPRALQDPGVTSLGVVGGLLWIRGAVDQAVVRNRDAVSLAQSLSHPFSLTHALSFMASTHLLRRKWLLAQERISEVIHLSKTYDLPYWLAIGNMFEGRIHIELGEINQGFTQLSQGLADFHAIGTAEPKRIYAMGR